MTLCRTPPVIKICEWGPWDPVSSCTASKMANYKKEPLCLFPKGSHLVQINLTMKEVIKWINEFALQKNAFFSLGYDSSETCRRRTWRWYSKRCYCSSNWAWYTTRGNLLFQYLWSTSLDLLGPGSIVEEKGKKNELKLLSGGLGRWKDSSAFSPPQTAIWLGLLADLFLLFSPNAERSPGRLTAGWPWVTVG